MWMGEWEHVVNVCMEANKGGRKKEIIRILEDNGMEKGLDKEIANQKESEGGEEGEKGREMDKRWTEI